MKEGALKRAGAGTRPYGNSGKAGCRQNSGSFNTPVIDIGESV